MEDKVCHEALETKMVPHNPCYVSGCDYSRVVITITIIFYSLFCISFSEFWLNEFFY